MSSVTPTLNTILSSPAGDSAPSAGPLIAVPVSRTVAASALTNRVLIQTSSSPAQPRVDDLVYGVAAERKAQNDQSYTQPREQQPPPGADRDRSVGEGVVENATPRHPCRVAEPEQRKRRLRQDRERNGEDRVREDDGEHVRQDVPGHQVPVAGAECP